MTETTELSGVTPSDAPAAPAPELPTLRLPADGIPEVTESPAQLAAASRVVEGGTGPVAIDAERASGHRYGQRAFLVQLRREGAGTFLIDPVNLPDMGPLAAALADVEWILHSATQDLPCLAELGLYPTAIFDTELAGRLLGLPRVGLAGLTEDLLGVRLAKGHGAADWSKRPLPTDWLAYAALDVELLEELQIDLIERLHRAGRIPWAEQEFAALLDWKPRIRTDPWRRTSGMHRVSSPRALAIARELWESREELARTLDRPPGRVLPDAAIIAAARRPPLSPDELLRMNEFTRYRRTQQRWWAAIERARSLPQDALPTRATDDGPPPPRTWERRNPVAAQRLVRARKAVVEAADRIGVAAEVLITPDSVRLMVWEAPEPDPEWAPYVDNRLAQMGARPWQREIVVPAIAAALSHDPQ